MSTRQYEKKKYLNAKTLVFIDVELHDLKNNVYYQYILDC